MIAAFKRNAQQEKIVHVISRFRDKGIGTYRSQGIYKSVPELADGTSKIDGIGCGGLQSPSPEQLKAVAQ